MEETHRHSWRKAWIALAVVAVWLIVATIAAMALATRPPDFFSSPLSSRDNPTFDNKSELGLLERADLKPESAHPAETPFAMPGRIDGRNHTFVLRWPGEVEGEIDPQVLPERLSPDGLLDDDSIELFGFATWMPQPDDDVDPDADWQASLRFRDPASLEIIAEDQLSSLGVPEAYRALSPPQEYKVGVIRLLFRVANMDPVRFVSGSGGDALTRAQVTYDLSSLEGGEDQAANGEWAHLDFALLLWHDKPLTFHLRVLTGEPEQLDLSQELGAQVAFGDRLRLQWLAREDGYFRKIHANHFLPAADVDPALLKGLGTRERHLSSPPDHFAGESESATASVDGVSGNELPPFGYRIEADGAVQLGSGQPSDGPPRPETFLRVSNDDYLDHLGRLAADGSIAWDFDGEGEMDSIHFASCRHTPTPGEPLRLVFLPQMAELTFEIAGAPDLPNPRDIEDLFELKIPRLTVSDSSPSSAERELISFIAVATQSGEELDRLWDDDWPDSMPSDRTFRNTTPQELINWYLQTSREAHARHDGDQHLLSVNQTYESVWQKFVDFILRR